MTLNFKFKVLLLISCFILCFVFDVIEGQVLAAGRMNTHYGSRSDELNADVGSNPGGGRDLPENKMKTSFQTSLVDLDEDYDFNVPPPSMLEPGGPVHVNFSINLRNIFQVTFTSSTPYYLGIGEKHYFYVIEGTLTSLTVVTLGTLARSTGTLTSLMLGTLGMLQGLCYGIRWPLFAYLHHNSQSLVIIFMHWTQLLD